MGGERRAERGGPNPHKSSPGGCGDEREREAMGLSLWTVVQAVLLFTNAFAILNEERFLKKHGITLASATNESFYGGPTPNNSLKAQVLAGFLHACSYLRVPLIFLNTLVIL